MTRINVLPPAALHDKHLLAEYRELPRVFNLARKAHADNRLDDLPASYTMGTGHVRFFYNKLQYLMSRFADIIFELQRRGVNFDKSLVNSVLSENKDLQDTPLWQPWKPDARAYFLNSQRIVERLDAMGVTS